MLLGDQIRKKKRRRTHCWTTTKWTPKTSTHTPPLLSISFFVFSFSFMISKTKLKGFLSLFTLIFYLSLKQQKMTWNKGHGVKRELKKDGEASWSTVCDPRASFHRGWQRQMSRKSRQNPTSPWHITVLLSAYIEIGGPHQEHIEYRRKSQD